MKQQTIFDRVLIALCFIPKKVLCFIGTMLGSILWGICAVTIDPVIWILTGDKHTCSNPIARWVNKLN